jgi:hypothetical protein
MGQSFSTERSWGSIETVLIIIFFGGLLSIGKTCNSSLSNTNSVSISCIVSLFVIDRDLFIKTQIIFRVCCEMDSR